MNRRIVRITRIAAIAAIVTIVGAGLFLFATAGQEASAQKAVAYENVTATAIDLGNPSADVIGQALAYAKGKPVFKAFKITIPPGKSTIVHSHGVNIFAYVLSGTLEVDYGTKGKKRFAPGEGFLEAVNWCHKGSAVGTAPAVLVAPYLGAPRLKNTIPCKT